MSSDVDDRRHDILDGFMLPKSEDGPSLSPEKSSGVVIPRHIPIQL